jgi:hypothetical protein
MVFDKPKRSGSKKPPVKHNVTGHMRKTKNGKKVVIAAHRRVRPTQKNRAPPENSKK